MTYQIDFYEDDDGYSEIAEYLKRLAHSHQKQDQRVYRKLTYQLGLLSQLGEQMHAPQAKKLKSYQYPLMELRPQPDRVFYAAWQRGRYVLLSHYTKKQNKTDPREIAKALDRLADWLNRKGE